MAVQVSLSSSIPSLRCLPTNHRSKPRFSCKSLPGSGEDYLIDAPESIGDGFSFTGGKYAEGPSRSDEWLAQGKWVKAHPVYGNKGKAKDPLFGLTMGAASQSSDDVFRWFSIEAGCSSNPTVILIHGFPSQAYSFRKVLPVLSDDYHAIAFDWLGFGFSDKPQPKYGFDYTLDEYTSSLESLIDELAPDKFSLVVQGYFAPVVVKYASRHQEKLKNLILINPPAYVESMRMTLASESWKVRTTVCWGLRDRWLSYDGVEDFCKPLNHKLVELPMAGHHVQEDFGEEIGKIIKETISKGKA